MDFSPDFQNFTGSGLDVSETNLSCADLSLQSNGTLLPSALDITIRVSLGLYFSLRNIIALALNGLIVFLVIKFKSLRTFSFGIAAMLATTNLCVSLLSTVRVFNAFAGQSIFDANLCVASAYLVLAIFSYRNALLLVFSVDRFANVFAPFNYPKYSRSISGILCALTYSIGFTVFTTAIPMDCYTYLPSIFTCIISADCSTNCKILNSLNIVYQIPLKIIPILCFIALYMKGRKIRQHDAKLLGSNLTLQEWRALKTFMVLFVAVFLVNTPPIFLLYVAGFVEPTGQAILQQIATVFAGVLSVTDAIVILKNADVKECLGKLIIQLKSYSFKK